MEMNDIWWKKKEVINMLQTVTVALDPKTLEAIREHPLSKDISRSSFVRIAVSEFLDKNIMEKVEKNEKQGEWEKGLETNFRRCVSKPF
jgi:Arc/MetJ-type ribon-helix-helix transcriptional regulator